MMKVPLRLRLLMTQYSIDNSPDGLTLASAAGIAGKARELRKQAA